MLHTSPVERADSLSDGDILHRLRLAAKFCLAENSRLRSKGSGEFGYMMVRGIFREACSSLCRLFSPTKNNSLLTDIRFLYAHNILSIIQIQWKMQGSTSILYSWLYMVAFFISPSPSLTETLWRCLVTGVSWHLMNNIQTKAELGSCEHKNIRYSNPGTTWALLVPTIQYFTLQSGINKVNDI